MSGHSCPDTTPQDRKENNRNIYTLIHLHTLIKYLVSNKQNLLIDLTFAGCTAAGFMFFQFTLLLTCTTPRTFLCLYANLWLTA